MLALRQKGEVAGGTCQAPGDGARDPAVRGDPGCSARRASATDGVRVERPAFSHNDGRGPMAIRPSSSRTSASSPRTSPRPATSTATSSAWRSSSTSTARASGTASTSTPAAAATSRCSSSPRPNTTTATQINHFCLEVEIIDDAVAHIHRQRRPRHRQEVRLRRHLPGLDHRPERRQDRALRVHRQERPVRRRRPHRRLVSRRKAHRPETASLNSLLSSAPSRRNSTSALGNFQ